MSAGAIALMAALALAATPLRAQTPDPPRAFLLFIDDLHLDFRQTPRTRALMQRLLRDVAREGDTWAVATTGTSSLNLAPTKDLSTLKSAVSRVTGNGLKPAERLLVQPGSNAASEMRHRTDVSYGTGVDAIRGLAAAAPGAVLTVLCISDGYDTRVVDGPQRLIDAATQARAAIVTLMPWNADQYLPATAPDAEWRAYLEAAQGSLRRLALETGGTTIFAAEDVDSVLQRLAKR